MDLAGLVAALQDAMTTPLHDAMNRVADLILPLWMAVIAGVVGIQALRAGTGAGGAATVQAAIGCILNLMLGKAALEHVADLADWSSNSAQQLSSLGGGGSTATPFAIANTAGDMLGRAVDHAVSQIGFLDFYASIPEAGLIIVAGGMICAAYIWLAFVVLCAWVEFFLGIVTMSPLLGFTGVPGFGQVAYHPVALLMSSTFRIAALGMLVSFSTAFIEANLLPDGGASITLLQVLLTMVTAAVVAFMATQGSRLVSHVMLGGGVGWNGASAAWGMATSMASNTFGGSGGGAAASASGGGSSRGGSGGGGGGGGGHSGPVPRRYAQVRP